MPLPCSANIVNAADIRGSLWQAKEMHGGTISRDMSRKLVDSLYVEAMVMADEARSYFDGQGDDDRDSLDIMGRVSFSCESLKVTTRLMHVIAWLLTQRAVYNGELRVSDLAEPQHRLGEVAKSEPDVIARFPFAARALIEASEELYERVARLEGVVLSGPGTMAAMPVSPARQLLARLESSF